MGKHAKVLQPAQVRRLLRHVRDTRHPQRNAAIILLSYKAGLRAGEIAGLDWTMIVTPTGKISCQLAIEDRIAKKGSGRIVPLNPELRLALERLHKHHERPKAGAVIRSERGGHMCARAVVNWFIQLYRDVGFDGCSSHSGRRTFITRSARVLAKSGGSLRDVQLLAGHRSIETTQAYIDGDWQAQRKLVRMI